MTTISTVEDFYSFLRESKIRLLANVIFSGSPGHLIWELDYFLRKSHSGELPQNVSYLWIQSPGPLTSDLAEICAPHFRKYRLGMLMNPLYHALSTQVLLMCPELGVDVGMSHLKNSWRSSEELFIGKFNEGLYYFVKNEQVVQAHVDYYRVRSLTPNFHPWQEAIPTIQGPFAEFLGNRVDRLALVHFRTGPGNAGITVPPEHFFPSFDYLRDNGFTIVKVGTEKCPEEFSRYGVIDYSGSPFRSFKNDLSLLAASKLNIINASGLENMADILDIPTVSYGRWHLTITAYSSKAVILPALLFDPVRQRLLTFAEQMLVFKTRPEAWEKAGFGWHFPYQHYVPRVPQADELCAAVKEAHELGQADRPHTAEQARYNRIDANGPLSKVRSRTSQFFIERFQALL